jgi:hypothetical protein
MAQQMRPDRSSSPVPVGSDLGQEQPAFSRDTASDESGLLPNGSGAAAILAAAIGSFALGVFSFIGDVSSAARRAFIIWNPSGPLSGVSTSAVGVWLVAWLVLSMLWRKRNVNLVRINVVSFVLLGMGLLLTFPPFVDLLQGK